MGDGFEGAIRRGFVVETLSRCLGWWRVLGVKKLPGGVIGRWVMLRLFFLVK